jgi:hypothetical protein
LGTAAGVLGGAFAGHKIQDAIGHGGKKHKKDKHYKKDKHHKRKKSGSSSSSSSDSD